MTMEVGPPSTPDPATVNLVSGQVRIVIGILVGVLGSSAGLGQVLAHVTGADISNYVTAFLTVIALLGWLGASLSSWWKEHDQAAAAHENLLTTATASARATVEAGRPVAVVATAPPKIG